MSEIISVPLNKLIRSERNVRKTGGESVGRFDVLYSCSWIVAEPDCCRTV